MAGNSGSSTTPSTAATELASIEFVGTGGTNITFELVGGNDIRDFYQGQFVTGSVMDGLSGTYVVDEQDFNLGSTFAGQTLTEIIITDTHNGSDPILLGVTVGAQSEVTAPEPSSLETLSLGITALFGFALIGRFA
jgi:hypothetical protein